MANQRHTSNDHIEEYYAPEPTIPATHDSIELTEEAVVVYDREDSRRWIWADEAVDRTECR